MNKITRSILELYDENITELDISNKNIIGIISLSKFKKLKKINCSHNQITKINDNKNIDINCSYNNIKFISYKNYFNEPTNITTNPIEEIEYPFQKK
jgi:Leucine-rich repeat (LRR) protein